MRALIFFLLLAAAVAAQPVKITFLHLNDVYEYGKVDDGRKGSLARVETLRKKVEAANPNTLFVLAGDTLSPSPASSFFKGQQMVDFWNAMGLDFATLGNHEFDFGDEVLKQRIKDSKFPWLTANVIDRKTGKPFGDTPTSLVREVAGVKIGFFGLLTPETKVQSKASEDIEFADPTETARKCVAELKADGAQLIVAITHLTIDEDKAMLRKNSEIDLVLGGHEHWPVYSLVGRTPVFKWGSDARILGQIDLKVEGGKILEIDWIGHSVGKSVKEDERILQLVNHYDEKLNRELSLPVANVTVPLEGRTGPNRIKETNLGNLLADCYRDAMGADVALMIGSSIRINSVVPPGQLTRKQVMMLIPYDNPVVKLQITGAQLQQALEHAVSRLGAKGTPFPQVSGLKFVYDPKRPPMGRVLKVEVGGQPLEPQRNYTMATSSFLRKGGVGFEILKKLPALSEEDDSPAESVIIYEELSKRKNLAPKVEGRIQTI